MITPEFLNEIVEQTEKTTEFMRTNILKRICDRIEASLLANEENIMIPSTITEINQLMDTGMMIEEIQIEVEKALPAIREEVRKAFLQSAVELSNYNTDIAKEIIQKEGYDIEIPLYERVGLPKDVANLNLTATEVRKLEQIYKGTDKMIQDMCRLLPVTGNEKYLRLAVEAIENVQGGTTIGQAITDSIHKACVGEKVLYTSGHVDNIEVAIARAVRTEVAKANSQIVLTRASEMGVEYVYVSEHYGARVTDKQDYTNHAMWQGKVYHLDWKKPELASFKAEILGDEKGFKWLNKLRNFITDKFRKVKYPYKDFVDVCGYGQMLGISGINCRHTFSPFFPDVQDEPESIVDDVKNQEYYEDTQRQREIERRIRKTKTEMECLKGRNYEETQRRMARLSNQLTRQTDELFKFADSKGFKVENWRLQVAKEGKKNVQVFQSKSQIQEHRRLRG